MTEPSGQGSSEEARRACVDASLVLRRVIPYERDAAIEEFWVDWDRQGVEICGPVLLYAEVTSTIRLRVVTEQLTEEQGENAFRDFNQLGVHKIDRDDLHVRAWELAKRYRQRRAYDMTYLALADLEDLDLWTGDKRLINALAGREPRVRWVPDTHGV